MATTETILSVLRQGPAHGYEVKRDHDAWFPDARPLAFGQVYATLTRLEKDGAVELVETRSDGGPERRVYALTPAGEARLDAWLAEPAAAAGSGPDEIVRKTVAALRTGGDAGSFLARQRAAHLRRMRELSADGNGGDPGAVLARDHLLAHLDADLRWLERAAERVAAEPAHSTRPDAEEAPR